MTSVRCAEPADARAIAEVHVASWRVAYRGVIPQETLDALDVTEREQLWTRHIPSPDVTVFVAEQEGRVVGFASVGPARDLEDVGELYAIYVHPDAWGTGAGPALMDACVDRLAECWPEAVLWVAEQNPRARRFYERYGWRPAETRIDEVRPGVHLPEVRYRLSGLDRR